MVAQSVGPLLVAVLVVFIPVFVVLLRRTARGFGAMSDSVSDWASGVPVGEWRCGFDLRRPARMGGSYPLGTLRVYEGGFALSSAVGRLEFAVADLERVSPEPPLDVRIFGRGRELRIMLRSSDAVQSLVSLRRSTSA
jgi:hypothetical protein